MADKYYVVADRDCPGSEHDTWEEAAVVLHELKKKGLMDARILCPPDYLYYDQDGQEHKSYLYPPDL